MPSEHWIELSALGLYLATLLWIGVRSARQVRSSLDYTLAGRSVGWTIVLATTAATMIGGGSSVGAVGKVFETGIPYIVVTCAWHLQLVFTGLFVAPRLRRLDLITVGDYFELRFGRVARGLAVFNCSIFLIGALAAQLVAMGTIAQNVLGIDYTWALIVGSAVTIFYSTAGGIRAVVKTDVIQFVILVVGLGTAAAILFSRHGGFEGFHDKLGPAPFRLTSEDWPVWKTISLFVAFLLGETFVPPYVTRTFIAKGPAQAKWGIAGAGIFLLVFLPVTTFVLGLAARLEPAVGEAVDGDAQRLFPELIRSAFHPVFAGVVLAALVAAVMSSADSCLNCGATIVMEDLYRRYLRSDASDAALLRVARLATAVFGVAAALLAWLVPSIVDLLVFVYEFWAPGMIVPFLVGIFWYREDRVPAVLVSMFAGMGTTVVWLLLEKPYDVSAAMSGFAVAVIAFLVALPFGRDGVDPRTES